MHAEGKLPAAIFEYVKNKIEIDIAFFISIVYDMIARSGMHALKRFTIFRAAPHKFTYFNERGY